MITTFNAEAFENRTRELALRGEITEATTATFLASLGSGPITVRINSPGGSVFQGLAIYNALKGRSATIIVDGLAGSVASVIAMSGRPLKMHHESFLMIHNAAGLVAGNASEMRKMGDTLTMLDRTIAGVYSQRTGIGADQIKNMMDSETWLTADEAKALGFCDEIIDAPVAQAQFRLIGNHIPVGIWNRFAGPTTEQIGLAKLRSGDVKVLKR